MAANVLGADLRALREQRGLSRRTAAEAAGVSPSTIRDIEVGRSRPSLKTLARLATCFHMNVVIAPHEVYVEPLD